MQFRNKFTNLMIRMLQNDQFPEYEMRFCSRTDGFIKRTN